MAVVTPILEEGFTRFDVTNSYIGTCGVFSTASTSNYYNGKCLSGTEVGSFINIRFSGRKIKLYGATLSAASSKINQLEFYNNDTGKIIKSLCIHSDSDEFQQLFLDYDFGTEGKHSVKVLCVAERINLDFIDIDGTDLLPAEYCKLAAPINGMKRYDDNNTDIYYKGSFVNQTSSSVIYNGTAHYISSSLSTSEVNKCSVNFYIYGDSIYLYLTVANVYSKSVLITIDGVEYIRTCRNSAYSAGTGKMPVLIVENLPLKEHEVIVHSTDGLRWGIDCIDGSPDSYLSAYTGTVLSNAENGMNRYNSLDSNIICNGSFNQYISSSYNILSSDSKYDFLEFYFYGTKMFILDNLSKNRSTNISCEIDGKEYTFSEYSSSDITYCVAFGIRNLKRGLHKVKVTNLPNSSTVRMGIQFIDIDGYICTPDGKYIDVTPPMISNTSPTGYSVTASSSYGSDYPAYKAFNGTNINLYDAWVTKSGATSGWIRLSSTVKTFMFNAIGIRSRTYSTPTPENDLLVCPSSFELFGSNDGSTFDSLYTFDESVNDCKYEYNTTRIFKLGTTYKYNDVKLQVNNNYNGANTYMGIGEMQFLLDINTPMFLINDNGVYKNIDYTTNELVEVDDLSILKKDIFSNECIYNIKDTIKYLNGISESKGLISNISNSIALKGNLTNKELVVFYNDFYTTNASIINKLIPTYSKSDNSNIKLAFSFDGGATWNTYNSDWEDLGITIPNTKYANMNSDEKALWESSKEIISTNGIDIDSLETIPFENIEKFKIAFVLEKANNNDECSISMIEWNFDEYGMLVAISESDIERRIINDTFVLKSNIEVDKIYVNVITCGASPMNASSINFETLTEDQISKLKQMLEV